MQHCCSDSNDMTKNASVPIWIRETRHCDAILHVIHAPFDSYLHFFNLVQYCIDIPSVSPFYTGKVKCTEEKQVL